MTMHPSRKLLKAFVLIMHVSKWEVAIVWRSSAPSPRGMRVVLSQVIQLPFVEWEVPVVLVYRRLGGVVLFFNNPSSIPEWDVEEVYGGPRRSQGRSKDAERY